MEWCALDATPGGLSHSPVLRFRHQRRAHLVKLSGILYRFRQGQQFHLLVAGDGKEKPRLQDLAEMNLGSKVHFMGKIPREKMYQFYSAGDLFAFPGIKEGLGMVFLEAQANGLPVVAFSNEGIPEVVQDRQTGFLIPMYAADPFDHAIANLLKDRPLREKMGKAARAYVSEEHDLNRNYRKMEKILQLIAGETS